jgi:hypothetical protein
MVAILFHLLSVNFVTHTPGIKAREVPKRSAETERSLSMTYGDVSPIRQIFVNWLVQSSEPGSSEARLRSRKCRLLRGSSDFSRENHDILRMIPISAHRIDPSSVKFGFLRRSSDSSAEIYDILGEFWISPQICRLLATESNFCAEVRHILGEVRTSRVKITTSSE